MLNEKLNVLLADCAVAHRKLQNLHWYVKGHAFFQAHAKLEEFYDEANEAVDSVAELILMNGGKPLASMKEYLDASNVAERESDFISVNDAMTQAKADYELILADVKAVKDAADEEGNALVSAAMDDHIAQLSKHLWMLGQSER